MEPDFMPLSFPQIYSTNSSLMPTNGHHHPGTSHRLHPIFSSPSFLFPSPSPLSFFSATSFPYLLLPLPLPANDLLHPLVLHNSTPYGLPFSSSHVQPPPYPLLLHANHTTRASSSFLPAPQPHLPSPPNLRPPPYPLLLHANHTTRASSSFLPAPQPHLPIPPNLRLGSASRRPPPMHSRPLPPLGTPSCTSRHLLQPHPLAPATHLHLSATRSLLTTSHQMRKRRFGKNSSGEFGVVPVGRKRPKGEENQGIYIPLDIVAEILKHLPVRVILNFRRVCKSWRSLIYSDHFIDLHLTLAEKRPPQFMLHPFNHHPPPPSSSSDKFGVELYSPPRRANGLPDLMLRKPDLLDVRICPRLVKTHCHGLNLMFSQLDIYVFNLCTQEFIMLPRGSTPGVQLMVGMGFSHSSKDYKVVRIFHPDCMRHQVVCEVLTLDSNREAWTWREVTCPEGYPLRPFSIYANGPYDEYSNVIISFDLQTETFRSIMLPLKEYHGTSYASLLKYEEHLCVSLYNFKEDLIELWVLEKDHANKRGTWTRECNFSLKGTDFSFKNIRHGYHTNPVNVSSGMVYMCNGERLGYYSIRDKAVRTITSMRDIMVSSDIPRESTSAWEWYTMMQAACYVESLISLQRPRRW